MYNATAGNRSFQKSYKRTGSSSFGRTATKFGRRPVNRSTSANSNGGEKVGRSPLFNNTQSSFKRPTRTYSPRPRSTSLFGESSFNRKPRENSSQEVNYNRVEKTESAPRRAYGSRNSFQRNDRPQFRGRQSNTRTRSPRRESYKFNESTFVKKIEQLSVQEEYKPSFKYADLDVHPTLKQNIKSKNYENPTPIQDKSIVHIIQGKDLLGIADTGTGKTAAFLIPLINKVKKNQGSKVIIITPTRELAEQINKELYVLTKDMRIFSVECIGGSNLQKQIYNLRRGYNFVVGTPGRLKDLHDRKVLNLAGFDTVVLDEVDRMLDMGFVNEIKHLISFLPEHRQSLFFSATVDRKVEGIIDLILKKDHIKISVKTGETAQNVDQDIVRIERHDHKLPKLEELLQSDGFDKVLVFVNTKRQVDKIEKHLYTQGFKVESIHGDKRQNVRKRSIEKFKEGHAKVLIATDVAARGLDIKDVTHVINYDIPNNYEDYIHRVGRTGRANKKGFALTFVERG